MSAERVRQKREEKCFDWDIGIDGLHPANVVRSARLNYLHSAEIAETPFRLLSYVTVQIVAASGRRLAT